MRTKIYLMAIVFALTSCSKEESDSTYSGCPTTSSCGCSNKTKSECESSSCCKWTTGQGCGCR